MLNEVSCRGCGVVVVVASLPLCPRCRQDGQRMQRVLNTLAEHEQRRDPQPRPLRITDLMERRRRFAA